MGANHPTPAQIGFPALTDKVLPFQEKPFVSFPCAEEYDPDHYSPIAMTDVKILDDNIITCYTERDDNKRIVKNFFEVFNVKEKKIGDRHYIPEAEKKYKENEFIAITEAVPLQNKKFLIIAGDFFLYNMENLKDGPEKVYISAFCPPGLAGLPGKGLGWAKYTEYEFKRYEDRRWIIEKKNVRTHEGRCFTEISPGKLIFYRGRYNFALSLDNLEGEPSFVKIEKTEGEENIGLDPHKGFDFFFPSKNNPEMAYTFENIRMRGGLRIAYNSFIYMYKIEDLVSMENKVVKFQERFKVSSMNPILSFGEYSEKYLLASTTIGLYIIDIQQKAVAAVSKYPTMSIITARMNMNNPTYFLQPFAMDEKEVNERGFDYPERKDRSCEIIKLKNGEILILDKSRSLYHMDVLNAKFVVMAKEVYYMRMIRDQYAVLYVRGNWVVIKLYDD